MQVTCGLTYTVNGYDQGVRDPRYGRHPRYDMIYNGKIPFEMYEFRDMRLSKGKFHGPNTKIMDLWFSMDFYGFLMVFLDGIQG